MSHAFSPLPPCHWEEIKKRKKTVLQNRHLPDLCLHGLAWWMFTLAVCHCSNPAQQAKEHYHIGHTESWHRLARACSGCSRKLQACWMWHQKSSRTPVFYLPESVFIKLWDFRPNCIFGQEFRLLQLLSAFILLICDISLQWHVFLVGCPWYQKALFVYVCASMCVYCISVHTCQWMCVCLCICICACLRLHEGQKLMSSIFLYCSEPGAHQFGQTVRSASPRDPSVSTSSMLGL